MRTRLSPAHAHRSAWPVLTAAVLATTLAVSVAALLSPALMDLFTRDLSRVRQGEWWRMVTPVLVQSSGWGQLVFNLVGLAVVGAALESRVSRGTWALVYVAGGVGSIAFGSVWHPDAGGGGSSDAVAALIGALAVLVLATDRRPDARLWPAQLYSVFFASYLTGVALGGVVAGIVAGNVAIILWSIARRALSPSTLSRACLAVVAGGGAVMTAVEDSHGTGILAGIAVASFVLVCRRQGDTPPVVVSPPGAVA